MVLTWVTAIWFNWGIFYEHTINSYARLPNLDSIDKGYKPFVDSESKNDSVPEDKDKLLEEKAVCKKVNANTKVNGNEEAEEEHF